MKNSKISIIDSDRFKEELPTIVAILVVMGVLITIPFFLRGTDSAISTFINGLLNSSLIIGVALGFSLIFGIAKQFKLSIGGYFVIAAYAMFFLFEVLKIKSSFDIQDNLIIDLNPIFNLHFENIITIKDSFYLLLLVILPLIPAIIFVPIFIMSFKSRLHQLLMILLPYVTGSAIFLFSNGRIPYATYTILSISLLIASLYYLEINQSNVVTISISLSILIIVLYLISPFIARYLLLMNIVLIFVATIAMLVDRYLLNQIRHSEVNVLIVTFSIALIFQSIVQIVYYPEDGERFFAFGVGTHSLSPIVIGSVNLFGNTYDAVRIVALIVIFLAVILLFVFINKTKMGLAMKAVSQDEEAAALVGIDIRKITAVVSGIGMALVGLSAVLTTPFSSRPFWGPYMGWPILILAIAVVTLGGMGSLTGTAVSAIIIGYTTSVVSIIDSSLSSVIPLAVILIIMVIKPNGLFGKDKELE